MFVSVILFPPSVNHNCAHPFRCLCHTSMILRLLFATATPWNQYPAVTSRTNLLLFFTCRVWELQVLPTAIPSTLSGCRAEDQAMLCQLGRDPDVRAGLPGIVRRDHRSFLQLLLIDLWVLTAQSATALKWSYCLFVFYYWKSSSICFLIWISFQPVFLFL